MKLSVLNGYRLKRMRFCRSRNSAADFSYDNRMQNNLLQIDHTFPVVSSYPIFP